MKKNYAVVLYIIITILYLLYLIGERIYIYRYIHVTSILLPPTNKRYLSQLLLRLTGVPLFWCDRSFVMFYRPGSATRKRRERENFPNFHPTDVVPDGSNIHIQAHHAHSLTYF